MLDVYYGDGAGGFRYVKAFDPGTWGIYGIRAADVTSDGRLDLLVVKGGNQLTVAAGVDGRFVEHSSIRGGSEPQPRIYDEYADKRGLKLCASWGRNRTPARRAAYN